ncbi:MAG: DUF1016 domain-containing protein [Nitrospirae bacterium]|nr:DUF1016 domain-containing protein [Nitrospirota bacterium]
MAENKISNSSYAEFLTSIKHTIQQTRTRAYYSANKEMVGLYWNIGKAIAERQEREGWGKSVVQKLSGDLIKEFPGTSGFSAPNLWFMRQMYVEYKDQPNLLQLVREIPWGHNITVMTKTKSVVERTYYLQMSAKLGWSRNILLNQIKAKAYERQVASNKQHNFIETLPEHIAQQAEEAMKDVYMLDFLGIGKPVVEREMERRMVNRIRDVILELGYGFSFIGNQYRIKLNDKEYFIDLLFYHRKLKSLVAIELKAGSFQPEYAGKMNFYLNLLDDLVKEPDENPSIGIILCAERDRVEVEYALRNINKPVGVAEYSLTKELPEGLAGKLPDAKEIEQEILKELGAGHE